MTWTTYESDYVTCVLCGTRRPRKELGYPDISEAGAGKQCRDESWCAKRVAEKSGNALHANGSGPPFNERGPGNTSEGWSHETRPAPRPR